MIFEYTNGVDLQEYLVMHSPQAGFAKPPSSGVSSHSSFIDHSDFVRMGIQVSLFATIGAKFTNKLSKMPRDLGEIILRGLATNKKA